MRRVAALVIGVGAAAVCARLGIWQLDRLGTRRTWNAVVEARLAAPALPLTSGVATRVAVDSLQYRRATATGVLAFRDQVTEGGKSLRGAPGVHVLTPLRFPDGTGILVARGWTYAPDAATAALAPLAEPETTTVTGVLLLPAGRRAVRPESTSVGYPLFPLVLRRTDTVPGQPPGLVPAPLPPRDAGPHLAYAVQWFVFGFIALVGGLLLARRAGSGTARAA